MSTPTSFAGEHAPVVQRHANLRCTIHHVIVGHDVAVRRNDDAAADSMLDLRLLRLSARAPSARRTAETPAESHSGGISPPDWLPESSSSSLSASCADTRDVTATLTTAGVTRAATASTALSKRHQRRHAAVVHRRGAVQRGTICSLRALVCPMREPKAKQNRRSCAQPALRTSLPLPLMN